MMEVVAPRADQEMIDADARPEAGHAARRGTALAREHCAVSSSAAPVFISRAFAQRVKRAGDAALIGAAGEWKAI
jgi:hypothetical protein